MPYLLILDTELIRNLHLVFQMSKVFVFFSSLQFFNIIKNLLFANANVTLFGVMVEEVYGRNLWKKF